MVVESEVLKEQSCDLSKLSLPVHSNVNPQEQRFRKLFLIKQRTESKVQSQSLASGIFFYFPPLFSMENETIQLSPLFSPKFVMVQIYTQSEGKVKGFTHEIHWK